MHEKNKEIFVLKKQIFLQFSFPEEKGRETLEIRAFTLDPNDYSAAGACSHSAKVAL